jgi:hypothetical protein
MDGGIFIRCLTSVFFYDGNGVDGVYNVVMAVRLTQSFAQNQDGFAFDGDDLRIVRWTFHSCFDRKYLMLD